MSIADSWHPHLAIDILVPASCSWASQGLRRHVDEEIFTLNQTRLHNLPNARPTLLSLHRKVLKLAAEQISQPSTAHQQTLDHLNDMHAGQSVSVWCNPPRPRSRWPELAGGR